MQTALVLAVLRELSSEETYPDLLVRALGMDCLAVNRGGRVFGEKAPTIGAEYKFDNCYATGRAFGDIDGDGRLDQVDDRGVSLGHGDGRFGILATAFVNQNTAMAFACGDLNHDGRDDVVMGTLGVRVFLGNADGTLTPLEGVQVPTFHTGGVPPELHLVDLDQDGELDVLGRSMNGPHVAFNMGNAAFAVDQSGVEGTSWARTSDLNADGLLDIVSFGLVTERSPWRQYIVIETFLTRKDRSLLLQPVLRVPDLPDYPEGFPRGLSTADLNHDGKPDILAGSGRGKLALFMGKGDGTFEEPTAIELPVSEEPRAVLVHDLDLDGLPDLAVGYKRSGTKIYWGVSGGFVDFTAPAELGGPAPQQLDVVRGLRRTFTRGDVNEDGNVDVSDALAVCEQLFLGRKMVCGDASDADDSGLVDISDPICLLRFLFRQGSPPAHPYPEPGGDTVSDSGHNFRQGIGVDIGCSYETFYGRWFEPCAPDTDPALCDNPIRQFIDVCVPELDCPPR
ncbi:MAG: VCBS repeat-containing protein [Planctomycetes bacterium]|nr:VCBS repeat-containing protein [Planctomycetota bacterium]